MKRLVKIAAIVIALLFAAFFFLRVPDTDPFQMRAQYGGEPSQFVELDDRLTVHLRDEGPRDATPLILLHGSNADLHTWQPWVDRLSSDYRVIRFDQIGHGLTGPAMDDDYNLSAFVADVDAVADKLGLETFVLGGNSMGGAIAMQYALEHPDRLDGLILVDAGGADIEREGDGNLAFTLAAMPVVGNVMSQMLPRSIVERSLSQSVSRQEVVTPEAVDRYWNMARHPGNRDATRKRFATRREAFDPEKLASIKTPVLVMWGEEDALIPYEAAGWFMKYIRNATLVNYAGVGHLPHEEVPDRSAKDVREWLLTLPLTTQIE